MRVVMRDGSIRDVYYKSAPCPPHRYTYIKRVNGAQDGPPRCCNCMKPDRRPASAKAEET